MKITCFPNESRRFIMTIFVDDMPWMDIHTKIFGHYLSLPECNSLESFQEKFFVLEYTKAKKYALDRLATRSYPSTQLKRLLEKNLVSQNTIQKILSEFKRLGYLNDEEWISNFVAAQMRRHIGAQMIVAKLIRKGVPQREAQNWVGKLSDSDKMEASIQHLLKTKYKNRSLLDYHEKQKVIASLARKGFDFEIIQKAIETENKK